MVWTERRPETRKSLVTNCSAQTKGTFPRHDALPNTTYDHTHENLKLSLEVSFKLSELLSDTIRSLPVLEKLLNESKDLKAKTAELKENFEKKNKSAEFLLTMFTSLDENNAARSLIHNNTIRNWSSLKPIVNPVIFTNSERLKESTERYGWQSLPLEKTGPNGMPVLKYMYLAAMENFKSDFYAFANSDILFTGGLLKTLVTAKYSYDLSVPILITGTRYNVANITDLDAKERSNLVKIAKERGELFLPWAADYFITTSTFPWKAIPEVIIGGLAYDNWIILHARENKFPVIDATKTAPAVHQTPTLGNFESHWKGHAGYNNDLLTKYFNKTIDYAKGQVICTEFVSSFENENVIFEKRAESMPHCYM